MKLTKAQRHIIEHALGWPKDYRNRFVTGPDCDNWDLLRGMVEAGLMFVARSADEDLGGMTTFAVTDAGRRALEEDP